ncbi:hypothetical protein HanIR_Chr12g0613451 [Helianthus annuus]|nr:hypothetical protein HanIR_Chr12g0613451 [Helianthus annuus]
MGIRVVSGVLFLEVLAYLLPLCNEDTGPVTPALIFRGVTFTNVRVKMEESKKNEQDGYPRDIKWHITNSLQVVD